VAKDAETVVVGSFLNLQFLNEWLVKQDKNILCLCSGWQDKFNLEDTLFAGAVIAKIKENFTIHCDSSLTAELLYNQHKDNLIDFASTLTHYHRLVERFGLIEDIKFCLTPDGANVLPLYENGKLMAN